MWQEKRLVRRHVVELPIKYRVLNQSKPLLAETKNLSETGLLFLTTERFEAGTSLELTIPVKDKALTVKGRVVYARRELESGFFRTGVQFVQPEGVFLVKMAEQLHQIDQYRKKLSDEEGHDISEEEAAERWIHDHYKEFSKFDR